ncbi:MAG TPA: fused MFS/spermidine synthase, partial [Thermoanaerobaculia bacterium]
TVGAIAGSLAGGFGLLPLLSATGCWQLVVALLALLAIGALVLAWHEPQRASMQAAAATAVLALLCLIATGPTAVWRHSGIGAGRAAKLTAQNNIIDWMRWNERTKVWDADGRESGVALSLADQYAFIVNGKSDGSARGDAGTQVMCGLVGAAFHPRPERALVVGLGTGSSAGWLAAIPTMKRVDVVELEPVVLDVARAMAPFNHGAMKNPKLHITIADAREVLLTTPYRYDVVASEPSNPFRAGIASLFTHEFYLAVEGRLTPRGVFAQWVQTYDVDPETLRTVYATLTSVFPHVQTWHTSPGDLLLVASNAPLEADAEALRARVTAEPYRSAIRNAWRTAGVEGFLSRFVANEEYARRAAAEALSMNTDDRTVIEFGFARSVGGSRENLLPLIQTNAAKLGLSRPAALRGKVSSGAFRGDVQAATALELARQGDEQAVQVAASMQRFLPVEAAAVVARLRLNQHRHAESATLVRRALLAYRTDPWLDMDVMGDAIAVAQRLSVVEPRLAPAMYELVSRPYAGQMLDNDRRIARAIIAGRAPRCGKLQIAALEDLEPNTPYRADILRLRVRCYGETRHPLAERARQELRDFAAKDVEELVSPPPQ